MIYIVIVTFGARRSGFHVTKIMNNNKEIETTQEVVNTDASVSVSIWPIIKPLFVFRFESGNLSKSKYAVTARTKEDALNKLRESLGEDDIGHLKFESMTEWRVETETNKTE